MSARSLNRFAPLAGRPLGPPLRGIAIALIGLFLALRPGAAWASELPAPNTLGQLVLRGEEFSPDAKYYAAPLLVAGARIDLSETSGWEVLDAIEATPGFIPTVSSQLVGGNVEAGGEVVFTMVVGVYWVWMEPGYGETDAFEPFLVVIPEGRSGTWSYIVERRVSFPSSASALGTDGADGTGSDGISDDDGGAGAGTAASGGGDDGDSRGGAGSSAAHDGAESHGLATTKRPDNWWDRAGDFNKMILLGCGGVALLACGLLPMAGLTAEVNVRKRKDCGSSPQ